MTKWTRKRIIEAILQRERDRLPLNLGSDRLDTALYQAGSRIFGSWTNALEAAGVSPDRIFAGKQWPPAQIIRAIRTFDRRKRPPSVTQLEARHSALVAAARRTFGSWSKAVIAAGCDPTRFQRVLPWTPERIVEAILVRAIKSEPLGSHTTRPRSLVDAAQRVFGSWIAAKEAAGIDTESHELTPAEAPTVTAQRRNREQWTDDQILNGIRERFRDRKRVNASAVRVDDKALYSVARRRFGNWGNALQAAGFGPNGPLSLTTNTT